MMAHLAEFIHMGGYGGYVWSCYGIAVLMKGALLWALLRRRRRLQSAL